MPTEIGTLSVSRFLAVECIKFEEHIISLAEYHLQIICYAKHPNDNFSWELTHYVRRPEKEEYRTVTVIVRKYCTNIQIYND